MLLIQVISSGPCSMGLSASIVAGNCSCDSRLVHSLRCDHDKRYSVYIQRLWRAHELPTPITRHQPTRRLAHRHYSPIHTALCWGVPHAYPTMEKSTKRQRTPSLLRQPPTDPLQHTILIVVRAAPMSTWLTASIVTYHLQQINPRQSEITQANHTTASTLQSAG